MELLCWFLLPCIYIIFVLNPKKNRDTCKVKISDIDSIQIKKKSKIPPKKSFAKVGAIKETPPV